MGCFALIMRNSIISLGTLHFFLNFLPNLRGANFHLFKGNKFSQLLKFVIITIYNKNIINCRMKRNNVILIITYHFSHRYLLWKILWKEKKKKLTLFFLSNYLLNKELPPDQSMLAEEKVQSIIHWRGQRIFFWIEYMHEKESHGVVFIIE